MNTEFVADIAKIQERARMHINSGPITDGYKLNIDSVVKALNQALATELVCVLRYRRHYFMARGIHSEAVAKEFLEHSNEEQSHADRIAERIRQIGGEPDFNPEGIMGRSHSEYSKSSDLKEMIKEDLIAERVAIDIYRELINYFGNADSTTRRLMEDILSKEEEHADDMANLLERS